MSSKSSADQFNWSALFFLCIDLIDWRTINVETIAVLPEAVFEVRKKLNDILENLPTNEDEVYGVELAENGNDCFNAYSQHFADAWNITQRQHQHMCFISLYFMSHLCLPIKMKFHKNGINNRRASFFHLFSLSSLKATYMLVQWFNGLTYDCGVVLMYESLYVCDTFRKWEQCWKPVEASSTYDTPKIEDNNYHKANKP